MELKATTACNRPIIPDVFLAKPAKKPGSPAVTWSHYDEAIASSDTLWQGSSRRWGDADAHVQRAAIWQVLTEAERVGFTDDETALALAIVRTESGFNPDAAARSTSASGLGQFIDATGAHYRINDESRFDLREGARAVVAHLKDLFGFVDTRFSPQTSKERHEFVYGVYHDGPRLNAGGREIARKVVMPWQEKFKSWMNLPMACNKNVENFEVTTAAKSQAGKM